MGVRTLMDAWGTLVAGSTIESGDAWDHLQAQGGGGAIIHVGATLSSDVLLACSSDIVQPITLSADAVSVILADIEIVGILSSNIITKTETSMDYI